MTKGLTKQNEASFVSVPLKLQKGAATSRFLLASEPQSI